MSSECCTQTYALRPNADEIKHKDSCTDEFNKNQMETEKAERKKSGTHDLFTRIVNLAFPWKTTSMSSDWCTEAYAFLFNAAHSSESPRLAALVVKVRLDAFVCEKEAINDMVTALVKEKADGIKHKDFGADEFNKSQVETEKTERKKLDIHDLFTMTFNPAFLRKTTSTSSEGCTEAYALLSKVAHSSACPFLAVLAVEVTALVKEKADEIKHKVFCTDESNMGQMETEKTERKESDFYNLFTRPFNPAFLRKITCGCSGMKDADERRKKDHAALVAGYTEYPESIVARDSPVLAMSKKDYDRITDGAAVVQILIWNHFPENARSITAAFAFIEDGFANGAPPQVNDFKVKSGAIIDILKKSTDYFCAKLGEYIEYMTKILTERGYPFTTTYCGPRVHRGRSCE